MIESFVLKLLVGIVMMWLLMPRKEVTDGFFRIQMLVAIGLSVLLVLIVSSGSTPDERHARSAAPTDLMTAVLIARSAIGDKVVWIAQIVAACVAYAGHIFWKLGRRIPGVISIYVIALLSLLSQICFSLSTGVTMDSCLVLLSDLSSSTVLGATLTGMLLGHWYLTTPTMSIGPLSWFTRTLAIAGLLRLVMSGIAFGRFGFASHDIVHLLWLIMRIVGGILIPFATSIAVAKILKYRNTQAATGVLFAALILVFMGEMAAALLERDLGIPY
jgi:hypothetical protein